MMRTVVPVVVLALLAASVQGQTTTASFFDTPVGSTLAVNGVLNKVASSQTCNTYNSGCLVLTPSGNTITYPYSVTPSTPPVTFKQTYTFQSTTHATVVETSADNSWNATYVVTKTVKNGIATWVWYSAFCPDTCLCTNADCSGTQPTCFNNGAGTQSPSNCPFGDQSGVYFNVASSACFNNGPTGFTSTTQNTAMTIPSTVTAANTATITYTKALSSPTCTAPTAAGLVGTWMSDSGKCVTLNAGSVATQLTVTAGTWWQEVATTCAASGVVGCSTSDSQVAGIQSTWYLNTAAWGATALTYDFQNAASSPTAVYRGAIFYNVQGNSPSTTGLSSLGVNAYGYSFYVQQVLNSTLSNSATPYANALKAAQVSPDSFDGTTRAFMTTVSGTTVKVFATDYTWAPGCNMCPPGTKAALNPPTSGIFGAYVCGGAASVAVSALSMALLAVVAMAF